MASDSESFYTFAYGTTCRVYDALHVEPLSNLPFAAPLKGFVEELYDYISNEDMADLICYLLQRIGEFAPLMAMADLNDSPTFKTIRDKHAAITIATAREMLPEEFQSQFDTFHLEIKEWFWKESDVKVKGAVLALVSELQEMKKDFQARRGSRGTQSQELLDALAMVGR